MKAKNKITVLLLLLIVSSYSYGQVRIANNNNNGIAPNSSAFIDASSTNGYNTTDNQGKGLVFPRVDLSVFTFSYSGSLVGNNYPTRFDGMIVYNIKEGGSALAGNTEGELTRGFWYYDNPSTTLTGGTWKPLGSGTVTPPDVNEDGSGNLTVGDNIYLTYTYTYPDQTSATWMVSNSKEGNPVQEHYASDVNQHRCHYRSPEKNFACPQGWILPTPLHWEKLSSWLNENKQHKGAMYWFNASMNALQGYYWGGPPTLTEWNISGRWWTSLNSTYRSNGQKLEADVSGDRDYYAFSIRCVKN